MKILEGIIVSTKMEKSSIVEVTSRTPHPMYRKLIKRSKKFTVDNSDFEPVVGKNVKIAEIKPMSKNKHFRILEILNLNKEAKKKNSTSNIKKVKKGAK